jgi:hypothetical protein
MTEVADTFSKDSSRLKESSSWRSWSAEGCGAGCDDAPVVLASGVPPSDERDTEWNEDMEDAGTCPFLLRSTSDTFCIDNGGYVCSTVSLADDWGACVDGLLPSFRVETEECEEADLREVYGPLGGSGGAPLGLCLVGASREMIGGDLLALLARSPKLYFVGVCFGSLGLPLDACAFQVDDDDRPSSTTQSLRSIRDVFLPRLGGDGDGDTEADCGGVFGAIRHSEDALGEIGASSRLGELLGGYFGMDLAAAGADDDFVVAAMFSKASILDCNIVGLAIISRDSGAESYAFGKKNKIKLFPERLSQCKRLRPSHRYTLSQVRICSIDLRFLSSAIKADFCLIPVGTGEPSVSSSNGTRSENFPHLAV